MDIEDARARCRDYVRQGMREHHAEGALLRAGFDRSTIQEVIEEYDEIRRQYRTRRRRFTRFWAALLFAASSGVFIYFAFLAPAGVRVFHIWLLAPAMFGILKFLLP